MKMRFFIEQIYILTGTLLVASGINIFLAPCRLSVGGVTSIATMLLYLRSIRISATNIAANAVLFVFGCKLLSKNTIVKTILGIAYLSVFLEITSHFSFRTDNLLIAAVSGGIPVGLGTGLILRTGASTGGSDFSALMIKRIFPHFSVSGIILITDGIIIAISGIVFKSFEITFCSLAALYSSCKMTDMILSFGYNAKSIRIFSEKYSEIARAVMTKHNRGISALDCTGMYTQKSGQMLLCISPPKELPGLIRTIKETDPAAFVIVSEVTEVSGNGF